MRLWTIQDAKDGDVLVCNEEILLFKSYSVQGRISVHCWYNGQTNNFHSIGVNDALLTTRNKICPATKEQHDILFVKMNEAGYTFDFEKKEVKKIHVIDEGKAEMDYCFTKMMNGEKVSSTWSEEDEKNLIEVISIVQNINSYDKQYDGYINWLKSIRQRHAWKPTKEQMYMLEWLTTNVLDDAPVGKKAKEVLYTLIEQLK